jgi:Tfp pilus assembly PilM family ATPase
VARSFSISHNFGRIRPPVRRVLVIDAGGRRLKLLLAQSEFGRLRILKEELIDMQAEGLVSPEEIRSHLQSSLREWGGPPIAIVLPQHVSISETIDLPAAPEAEVEKLIHDQTLKLSGVTESPMVYDFVCVSPPGAERQRFWVTLAQENEIRERILRLGIEQEDLCDVTTTANALVTAYRQSSPDEPRALLVHMGAQTTFVVVVLEGRAVFAGSFQMGGDFFTRALARAGKTSEESAETLKRTTDVFAAGKPPEEFVSALDGWVTELKGQFNEWFTRNKSLGWKATDFRIVVSGGGFEQPGLLKHLVRRSGLQLHHWPTDPRGVTPGRGFEVAFGTALQAIGDSSQPVSLLPADYRQAWLRRLGRQRLEWASFALVLIAAILLAFGTWHNLRLASWKSSLITKVESAQKFVNENAAIEKDLLWDYENVRAVFQAQRNTLDILQSLKLLQSTRGGQSFYYVLVTDQQSYFTLPSVASLTNQAVGTNTGVPAIASLMAVEPDVPGPSPRLASSALTNASPARPGLIAELCLPEEPETARRMLSDLVKALKAESLFNKADLLSDDLRRSLADSRVVLPDKHFALLLDFAETNYARALPLKEPTNTTARVSRHAAGYRPGNGTERAQ